MSDVSQIAPRVAAVAQSRGEFQDWSEMRSGLLSAGFGAEESEHIGQQLRLDWSRPLGKFEILAAIESWVEFHCEFETVTKRGRRRYL